MADKEKEKRTSGIPSAEEQKKIDAEREAARKEFDKAAK